MAHRDKSAKKEQEKAWLDKPGNREKRRAYARQWRKDNPGKRQAGEAKYRKNNRCAIRTRSNARRHSSVEIYSRRKFQGSKSSAKQRGLEFDISLEDIKIPDVCPVFLTPLNISARIKGRNLPSLDRVDSSKGYVKHNVAVISWRANACKSDMTIADVRRLLAYMEFYELIG